MAFRLNGVIDLQELIPLGDRTRPTKFYSWSKEHSGQVPVGTFEAAVEGPIYDLKAYLESIPQDEDTRPDSVRIADGDPPATGIMHNGKSLSAEDVTPEIEQEWQTFLKVANDHFRLSMENFAHYTDAGKEYTKDSTSFNFTSSYGANFSGLESISGGKPKLILRGEDGSTFETSFPGPSTHLRVEDKRPNSDNPRWGDNIEGDSVEIDAGDRIWDSLLEHGTFFDTSHPAIQQRFPEIKEGYVRRESDGSYQLYDGPMGGASGQDGQPIPDNRYNSDYTPAGVSSGTSATPGAAGLPSGADLLATTLVEKQGEGAATDPPAIADPPVVVADPDAAGTTVGESVVGQGETYHVDGLGAVEVNENGEPQYNRSQLTQIYKSYLRTQIGSDHPGIAQFVDAYLGNETVAPRGAPPTNMRDWAIQQQLDRILRDRGITSGDSTASSEVSSGGLAPLTDTGGLSGIDLSSALGVLGDIGLGVGGGGFDLSAFLNTLPGLNIGDLNLPDIDITDIGLPSLTAGDLGLPSLTADDLNLPDIGIGDLNLPGVGVGDLNLPGVSVSDLGLPSVGVGDLGLPGVSVSDLNLPDVDVGDLGLPGVDLGDLGLPGVTLSDLGLPAIGVGDLGLPSVDLSDLGLPSVGVDDLGLPGVGVGDLGLPGVTLDDLGLPDIGIGDLGLPDVGVGDLGLPGVSVGDLGLPDVGVGDLGLPGVDIGDLGLPAVGVGDLNLPGVSVGDLGLPGVTVDDLGLPDVGVDDLGLPSLAGLRSEVFALEQNLAGLDIPNLDLGPLTDLLTDLEGRVGGLDTSVLTDLSTTIRNLNTSVQGINVPDLTEFNNALANLNVPSLQPLTSAINDLTTGVQGIGLPDFSGTTLADLGLDFSGLDLSQPDIIAALTEFFGGDDPLGGIGQSLTDLLGTDFGGGDVFNEYITNVTGDGGLAFDPVAFGRGLVGHKDAPHGYDYLNMGFLDLLRQAKTEGILGPGIAGPGGLDPTALSTGLSTFFGDPNALGGLDPAALQLGLGNFFFGDDYAPTVGPDGVFDDLGFLGADSFSDLLNNQFSDFRTGLGLSEGQDLSGLISSLIPNQPQLDPMFTDPTAFFDQLTQALITAVGTAQVFPDGTTAPASWYADPPDAAAGAAATADPPAIQFDPMPALEMPAITDFTDFLRYPLYEGVTGAIGSPNPFDTRRDAITKGPLNALERTYEESRENLISRYGTMNMMGSPAFHAQMRKLDRDRADAGLRIESDFGIEAAKTDEPLRRNRLADLAGALSGERGYVRDEQQWQYDLQKDQQDRYMNYIINQIKAWNAPEDYSDEGLRLGLGGIGSSLAPAIGASLDALGGIAGAAGNQITGNNKVLADALGLGGGQGGLWS